jgi:hypothetical protein
VGSTSGILGRLPAKRSATVRIWRRGLAVVGRLVEAGLDRLGAHRAGGLGQGDEDADLRLLALHDMGEVADHGDADVGAALDRDDRLRSCGRRA